MEKTFNSKNVSILNDLIAVKMSEVLTKLEVDFRENYKYISCACPVHGGDNITAINYYKDGRTVAGYWVCNTRHCERVFKATALGFIWGVLSNRSGWSCSKDKKISFSEAINFACDFLNVKLDNIDGMAVNKENLKFISQMDSISQKIIRDSRGVFKTEVRKSLSLIPKYYLDKNYSKDVLDKFDVGICTNKQKDLYGRVVVPIYDDCGTKMVCCTARKIEENNSEPKWINRPKECHIGDFLYNFWNAKDVINKTKTVVVVEGPGCVWRLWQAGCYNCVALFGSDMTERQQILLEKTSCMNIILLLDNDEAGRTGVERIKKDLSGYYNIKAPKFDKKDIGEYTDINELKQFLAKEGII